MTEGPLHQRGERLLGELDALLGEQCTDLPPGEPQLLVADEAEVVAARGRLVHRLGEVAARQQHPHSVLEQVQQGSEGLGAQALRFVHGEDHGAAQLAQQGQHLGFCGRRGRRAGEIHIRQNRREAVAQHGAQQSVHALGLCREAVGVEEQAQLAVAVAAALLPLAQHSSLAPTAHRLEQEQRRGGVQRLQQSSVQHGRPFTNPPVNGLVPRRPRPGRSRTDPPQM